MLCVVDFPFGPYNEVAGYNKLLPGFWYFCCWPIELGVVFWYRRKQLTKFLGVTGP